MLSLVTCFPGPLSRVSKVPRYHDPSRKDSNGTEDDDRGLMDERSEELNGEGIIRLQELTSHSLVTSLRVLDHLASFLHLTVRMRSRRGDKGTVRVTWHRSTLFTSSRIISWLENDPPIVSSSDWPLQPRDRKEDSNDNSAGKILVTMLSPSYRRGLTSVANGTGDYDPRT